MHHSTGPDQDMRERLAGMFTDDQEVELGGTGRFPEGKLTDADGGEIKFQIGYTQGKVIMDFGNPTAWVGMTPRQAKELAHTLVKWATPITRPSQ